MLKKFLFNYRMLLQYKAFIKMIETMPQDLEDARGYGQMLRDLFIEINGIKPELVRKQYGL